MTAYRTDVIVPEDDFRIRLLRERLPGLDTSNKSEAWIAGAVSAALRKPNARADAAPRAKQSDTARQKMISDGDSRWKSAKARPDASATSTATATAETSAEKRARMIAEGDNRWRR